MIIVLIIYILMILYGLKFRKDKNDYLSKDSTGNIKGIFTVMILLSHFRDYASFNDNGIYVRFLSLFGQLMVTVFLFYSGYGIMESLKSKKNYMKSFFSNRFLKTLLHFDLAVILYIIVSFILGSRYSLLTYLLSFVGWTSVGNSNWFVFVILSLYLLTYISNLIFSNNKKISLIFTTVLSCLLIITLYFFKEDWWYNIILCYPCGMWYSYYKDKIECGILSKYKYALLVILIVLFIFLYKNGSNLVIYELLACVFCLLIINFTYIFYIGNRILSFLGLYSFEIYILQRIPYSLLFGIFSNNLVYFIVSLIFTIVIAILFKKLTNFFDKKLFYRGN